MSFARRSVINLFKIGQSTDNLEGTCFSGITQFMERTRLDNTRYQLLRA